MSRGLLKYYLGRLVLYLNRIDFLKKNIYYYNMIEVPLVSGIVKAAINTAGISLTKNETGQRVPRANGEFLMPLYYRMKRRAEVTNIKPDAKLLDKTGKAEVLLTAGYVGATVLSLFSGHTEILGPLNTAVILRNFIVHSAMNITESEVGQQFVDKVERVIKEIKKPSTVKPIDY